MSLPDDVVRWVSRHFSGGDVEAALATPGSSRGPKITSSFSSASAAALTAILSERSLQRRTPSESDLLATHLIEYGYDIRTVPEAFRFVDDNDLHPCS
jgi:hypothetical protein